MDISDSGEARVLSFPEGEPVEQDKPVEPPADYLISTTRPEEILEKNYSVIVREWFEDVNNQGHFGVRFTPLAIEVLVDFFTNTISTKIQDRQNFYNTLRFLVSLWACENVMQDRCAQSIDFESIPAAEQKEDFYVLSELNKKPLEKHTERTEEAPRGLIEKIRRWVRTSINSVATRLELLKFHFDILSSDFKFPHPFIDAKNHHNGHDEDMEKIVKVVKKLIFDPRTNSITIDSASPSDIKPNHKKRLTWLAAWKREETNELRGNTSGVGNELNYVIDDRKIKMYKRRRPAADEKYTFEELHGIPGDPPKARFNVAIDLLIREAGAERLGIDFQKARNNFNAALEILKKRIEEQEALSTAEEVEQRKIKIGRPPGTDAAPREPIKFRSLHDRKMLLNPKKEELESFGEVINRQIQTGESFLQPVVEMHAKFPTIPLEVIFEKWLKNPAKSKKGLEQSLTYMLNSVSDKI